MVITAAHITPLVALIAGIPILIVPRLLNTSWRSPHFRRMDGLNASTTSSINRNCLMGINAICNLIHQPGLKTQPGVSPGSTGGCIERKIQWPKPDQNIPSACEEIPGPRRERARPWTIAPGKIQSQIQGACRVNPATAKTPAKGKWVYAFRRRQGAGPRRHAQSPRRQGRGARRDGAARPAGAARLHHHH